MNGTITGWQGKQFEWKSNTNYLSFLLMFIFPVMSEVSLGFLFNITKQIVRRKWHGIRCHRTLLSFNDLPTLLSAQIFGPLSLPEAGKLEIRSKGSCLQESSCFTFFTTIYAYLGTKLLFIVHQWEGPTLGISLDGWIEVSAMFYPWQKRENPVTFQNLPTTWNCPWRNILKIVSLPLAIRKKV